MEKIYLLYILSLGAQALGSRHPKVFSIFNIVRIPNLMCEVGKLSGICLSPADLSAKGYTSIGSCASGFGQCGTQKITKKGEQLSAPISYLQNPTYPSTDTSVPSSNNDIYVENTDVCQIRLDFEEFEIQAQTTAGKSCADNGDYMRILSGLSSESRVGSGLLGVGDLCGINVGQHMYIGDFNATDNDIPGIVASIKTVIGSGTASKYNVKVTQIDCKSTDATMMDLRAPPDCRQFYRDSTGTVTNYNFGNDGMAVYELNQDYKICIRRKMSDCQISWSRTSGIPAWFTSVGKNIYQNPVAADLDGDFYCYKGTGATGVAAGTGGGFSNNGCGTNFKGSGCVSDGASNGGCNDWLVIPEGRYLGSNPAATTGYGQNDIYCGVGVGWDEELATVVTNMDTDGESKDANGPSPGVISQAGGVWSLRFHTDSSVTLCSSIKTGINSRIGFSLDYKVSSTCTDTTLATAKLIRNIPPQIQASIVETEAQVVTSANEDDANEDNVSLKQVLQKLNWFEKIWAEQSTLGPVTTTRKPFNRYEGWNRFPYEETPRNYFKNPPGYH